LLREDARLGITSPGTPGPVLLNDVIDLYEKADGLDWRSNADFEVDRPSPG